MCTNVLHVEELKALKKPLTQLHVKGNQQLLQNPKISIVGTRRPISYTKNTVTQIARNLSNKNITIVSGGAMGVDKLAHSSAQNYNTIAVMPCCVDIVYPKTNKAILQNIGEHGLLVSQFDKGTKPAKWTFVIRNEVVVALGELLIIGEADLGSGSLTSARFAKDMGKEIWVLPHRLNESLGTNELIKKGVAKAIYDIDEFCFYVLDKLKIKYPNFDFTCNAPTSDQNDFVQFCKDNPSLDTALQKYGDVVYESELLGIIEIKDNKISLL